MVQATAPRIRARVDCSLSGWPPIRRQGEALVIVALRESRVVAWITTNFFLRMGLK